MKTWIIVLILVAVLGIVAYFIFKPKNDKGNTDKNSSNEELKKDDKTNIFAVISGISAVLANSKIKLKGDKNE